MPAGTKEQGTEITNNKAPVFHGMVSQREIRVARDKKAWCPVHWLVGWLAGWLVGWLVGWLFVWLLGWHVQGLVSRPLVGWLVGWLVGSLFVWLLGWHVSKDDVKYSSFLVIPSEKLGWNHDHQDHQVDVYDPSSS